MNTEQITRLKQLKEAIELRLNGDRNIEVLYKNENAWREFYGSDDAFVSWIDDAPKFRPRPQSETRPWSKPEDVPGPVCWTRCKDDPKQGESMVVGVDIYGIESIVGNSIKHESWKLIRDDEYSTDRQTWLPCTCPK